MSYFLSLVIIIGFTKAHASSSKFYRNKEGCSVEVEQTPTGYLIMVQDADAKYGAVRIQKDYASGDIIGFCTDAKVRVKGDELTVFCDEQVESGAYSTRGTASITGINAITAISIKGEVKKLFGWKTDTLILCTNLELQ